MTSISSVHEEKCTRCGSRLITPEWDERVNAREVQYLWRCGIVTTSLSHWSLLMKSEPRLLKSPNHSLQVCSSNEDLRFSWAGSWRIALPRRRIISGSSFSTRPAYCRQPYFRASGGGDDLQFLSSGYWWNASRRPSKLCGYRQHALNHRSFLEGVSSPKPQQNA